MIQSCRLRRHAAFYRMWPRFAQATMAAALSTDGYLRMQEYASSRTPIECIPSQYSFETLDPH